jgi:hypothetical protein
MSHEYLVLFHQGVVQWQVDPSRYTYVLKSYRRLPVQLLSSNVVRVADSTVI